MMELLRETAERWGVPLQLRQVEQFERYYRELVEWNQRINLTRIIEYDSVQARHFLDSLSLLVGMRPIPGFGQARVVDVGAGPGLPGIALKIACPRLQLTLIESAAKKAAFLTHVVEALALSGVEVLAERAEEVAHQAAHREAYTFALARALADLPAALELTLPFVSVGGRVLLPRKGDLATEVAAVQRALTALGGRHVETYPVELPGETDGRGVVVIEKVTASDLRYPRRPGIPAKRPLK